MIDTEIHPIQGGFIPRGVKVLVIGTFPPEEEYTKKRDGFFFYSSVRNHFWNRIDNIFPNLPGLKKTNAKNKNETFEQNRKRKEKFSEANQLGFIDIFMAIKRKHKSTKDEDLIPVKTILENSYLKQIIMRNNLVRICCTYRLAYETLKDGIISNGYSMTLISDKYTANNEKLLISINEKKIEIVLLYPATRSAQKGKLKDEQYKRFLFN